MKSRGTAAVTSFLVGLVVVVFALQASLRQHGGGVSTAFATAQSSGNSKTLAPQVRAIPQTPNPMLQAGAAALAGTATKIWITPRDTTITAGDTLTLIIEVQDSIGGPATLTEDREFSLFSGPSPEAANIPLAPEELPWQFFDPDNPNTPIYTLTLTAGTSIRSVLYRNTDTNDGNPHTVVIQSKDGILPILADMVKVTVTTTIETFVFDVGDTVWTAGEPVSIGVRAMDEFGNLVDDSATNVTLSSTTGNVQFDESSGLLGNGRFSTTATDEHAEEMQLIVAGGGEQDSSAMISVVPSETVTLEKISGDATGVTVGDSVSIEVRVADTYDNDVPGEWVVFHIDEDPGGNGFLSNDATTYVKTLNTRTDAIGGASVWLHPGTTVGSTAVIATIRDGAAPEHQKMFTVSTRAGDLDHLTVTPDTTEQLAGEAVGFTVNALDVWGNAVDDSTTIVVFTLDSGSGGVFADNNVTLQHGTFTSSVTTNTAPQTMVIRATSQSDPGVTGVSEAIQIRPNHAAGEIVAEPDSSTITGDGFSITTVRTTQAIQDAFGNIVAEGTLIDVSVTPGEIFSPDAKPGDGVQRPTDASGHIEFDVRSSLVGATPDTATVTMDAVEPGTASGTTTIIFAPEPAITSTGPSDPRIVMPGESVAFSIGVQNNSATGVTLDTGTTFRLDDGNEVFEDTLQADTYIAGDGAGTLVFNANDINALMATVQVVPAIDLHGTDDFRASYRETIDLPPVYVAPLKIVSISPYPPVVSTGQTGTVTVNVHNDGPVAVEVDSVSLDFSPGGIGDFTYEPLQTPAVIIAKGVTEPIPIEITIAGDAPEGQTTINASVSGTVDTVDVWDTRVEPLGSPATWEITAQAAIVYETDSLAPQTVSAGQTRSFSVVLENAGGTAVELDSGATTLSFTDGTRTYLANLTQNEALGRGESQRIEFVPQTVPADIQPGQPYDVLLHLEYEENGTRLIRELHTADQGEYVLVQTAADVSYADSLYPQKVARGTLRAFRIDVSNAGSASVELKPDSTWFSFGGPSGFKANLDPNVTTTIGNDTTTLGFEFETIDINTGPYTPQVRLFGVENGLPFDTTLNLTDDVTVVAPAEISITSLSVQPLETFTADQTQPREVWMVVSNNTDTDVDFDRAELTFKLPGEGDQTSQFNITNPTEFDNFGATLPGRASDRLTFTVSGDGSGDMQTGIYSVEGWVWVTDVVGLQADSAFSDAGRLIVQVPGELKITQIVPEQNTVTRSQTQPWTVTMHVRNTGGATVSVGRDQAALQFSGGAGWSWSVQNTTPVDLNANDSTTVGFTIDQTGDATGVVTINGSVDGTEINTGDQKTALPPAQAGLVTVQTPADLEITSVELSDTAVTEGQERDWTIDVTVKNNGEADVELSTFSTETFVAFPSANPPTIVAPPPVPITLGDQDTTVVTFTITQTPDFNHVYDTPHDINIQVAGTETNTDAEVSAVDTASIQVDLTPDPLFESLKPSAADEGKPVTFSLELSETAGAATVELDAARTRLFFEDTVGHGVRATLDPDSATTIVPGTTTTLWFEERYVPDGFVAGPHEVSLVLEGTENNNEFFKDNFPGIGSVEIRPATSVRIDTVYASRDRVSQDQDRKWTVTMVVTNEGDGAVRVDPTGTKLDLRINEATAAGYEYDWEAIFQGSGTNEIPAGPDSQDALVFTITQTGSETGVLGIHGVFAGQDVDQGIDVGDNTYAGRWGTILVERAGQLRIVGIETSQDPVTAGQSTEWQAFVSVQNEGEAAVDLTFDPDTPEVRPTPDSGFEWVVPDTLDNGDTLLAGDSVGTLVFTATQTGSTPGDVTLHARVAGHDVNSTFVTAFDTELEGSGFGEIHLDTLGRVVVKRTTVVAPRAPYVNIGQVFGVEVELANEGEADLRDVEFSISSNGGSGPPSGGMSTLVADGLPGGGSVIDTFAVQADDALGSETFTVDIVTGVDVNSNQEGLFDISPHDDYQADIEKQQPASLSVELVTTSKAFVTRSQVQDWYVDVAVKNDGVDCPPIDLVPPRNTDVSFWLDVDSLTDYEVIPPDAFLSGAPDLRLDPGESETLRYTVASTGADPGQVTIRAVVSWDDANNPITAMSEGTGSVNVVNPSGFFIDSTTVDSTTAPNSPRRNRVYVNDGVTFGVDVTVQNSGTNVEDLKDVRVELRSDNLAGPVLLSEYAVIPRDESYTFHFTEVDLEPLGAGEVSREEILTSRIEHAVSENTGQTVTPQPSVDNQELIIIQHPAELTISASVPDTTLSTNQTFPLTVIVSNRPNAADVDATTGRVTVTVPDGFLVGDALSEERSFVVEEPAEFMVSTPSQPTSPETLLAVITTVPNDLNIGSAAAVEEDTALVVVHIVEQASLSGAFAAVDSPAGAVDNIVSTGQEFVIRGSVFAEDATRDIWARLDVFDPAFNVVGGSEIYLDHGAGATMDTTWTVIAPSNARTGDFQVRFDGYDENSDSTVSDTSSVLTVEVVPRAEITLDAYISRPPEVAADHKVYTGTTFDISAVVDATLGHAGVDPDSPARVQILFDEAPEYHLDPVSQNDVIDFEIGEPVTWTVRAPDNLISIRNIVVEVVDIPADENSGSAAFVLKRSVEIPIETKQSSVTVENLTHDKILDKKVVPRGTRGLKMLAIELENGGMLANRVRIDSIGVSLLDRAGNVVDPSRTISRFYARIGERPDSILGQVTANRMSVDLLAALGGVELALGEAETFVFSVDISRTAELDEITLSIESAGDILIRDMVSPEHPEIGVVYKNDPEGGVQGRLQSYSLVILSNNFEEYAHNYPNPFRAGAEVTRIAYIQESESPAPVTVKIFDLTGDLVYEHSYAAGEMGTEPGPREVTWDGRNMQGEVVRNGVYICQVQAGSRTARIRIAVAK